MALDISGIQNLQKLPQPNKDQSGQRVEAARQFEALLISQIMRIAREATSKGWFGTGEDTAATPAMEFAEDHLARAISSRGGLGLASMIITSLEKAQNASEAAQAHQGITTTPIAAESNL